MQNYLDPKTRCKIFLDIERLKDLITEIDDSCEYICSLNYRIEDEYLDTLNIKILLLIKQFKDFRVYINQMSK